MMFERKMMSPFKMLLVFSLCFSLVFAVSLTNNDTKRMLNQKTPTVLILGAGIAGITAAKTLFEAGVGFLVLEASGRIGGRLMKEKFRGGGVVELGGNWVHGTDNNPIWTLVQEAGLTTYSTMIEPTETKYIVLDKNGNDVTADDGHIQMKEEVNKCLEKRIEELREERRPDISVRDGLTACGWSPEKLAQTSIEYFYHDFDAARPPETISCGVNLKTDGDIDSTGGRQMLISDERGYETIIKNLANGFMLTHVRYNHVVTKIIRDGNGVVVQVYNAGKRVYIKADFVLVTFSTGALQGQLKTMFDPPLPHEFEESLKRMKMGNYLKIFLKFSERFWPENYDYIFYASKKRGFYPVWQNLPGTRTKIPENEKILLVTVTGKEAWELGQKENSEIEDEIVSVLVKVFAKKISELQKRGRQLKSLGIVLKNWGMDQFFRGSYSNPTVGTTSFHFDTLLKPVYERLFFAGEGLSELYYGFLQGAYITGQNQANKIAEEIRNMLKTHNRAENIGVDYVLRKSIGKPGNETKH